MYQQPRMHNQGSSTMPWTGNWGMNSGGGKTGGAQPAPPPPVAAPNQGAMPAEKTGGAQPAVHQDGPTIGMPYNPGPTVSSPTPAVDFRHRGY